MQIKEIKVAELPDFVNSELWQQLQAKPLTKLRAISQFHNPRARGEDTALIIAFEKDTLLGLMGLLPHLINGQTSQSACSNSCWWAHPEKGKQVAIPLFLRAFALCGQRMFMTDCTPHTIGILRKTNWFEFPETPYGIRGFLKFNLHEIIPVKVPTARKLKPFLKLSDQAMNLLTAPYRRVVRSRFISEDLKVETLHSLNKEQYQFIENQSQNEFTRRSGTELEWIVQFPWIKTKPDDQVVEYPFSHVVKSFEQYFVNISLLGKAIALLMVAVRDGQMKVPYAYFQEKDASKVLKVIYREALLKNAVTLTIFCPPLVAAMDSAVHPFIFRKKIKRLVAVSKQLSGLYRQFPKLQDGDGDVVFT